ncbi:MAG: hypothetical protein V4473_01365 [Patescibacteria group bacterium]
MDTREVQNETGVENAVAEVGKRIKGAYKTKPVRAGVVGIGGCGGNIADILMRILSPTEYKHLKLAAFNMDHHQLQKIAGEIETDDVEEGEKGHRQEWLNLMGTQLSIVGLGGEDGKGAGGDPEVGAAAARDNIDLFLEFLEGLDSLIIVAGLSKGTGTGVTPVFAKVAVEKGVDPLVIVAMPSLGENGKNRQLANAALESLFQICTTIPVYNENVADQNQSLTNVWKEINESCIIPMLLALKEVHLRVWDQNVDNNDWRSALKAGHYGYFGLVKVTEDAKVGIEAIAEALLSNRYQNKRIWIGAECFALLFFGKRWTVADHNNVAERIRQKKGAGVNMDTIRFTYGVKERGTGTDNWVAVLAVSKIPPDMNAPEHSKVIEVSAQETPRKELPDVEPAPLLLEPAVEQQIPVVAISGEVPVPVDLVAETEDRDRTRRTIPATNGTETNGNGTSTVTESTRLVELPCTINFRPEKLKVTEDLLHRWDKLCSTRSTARSSEVEDLRSQIKNQTGFMPDIPVGLSLMRG